MRSGSLAAPLLLAGAVATGSVARAEEISAASFGIPTAAYDHAILGDALEWSELTIETDAGRRFTLTHPEGGLVFEDLEPRLWDVTGDGSPEVVVIETDPARGARLAIFGLTGSDMGRLAVTEHIGRTHRWLAPVAAADLDGDGQIEIAYVDRPHLAKELVILHLQGQDLIEIARVAGFTNHRIGWNWIGGGLRDCGSGPELVLAEADWANLAAVSFENGELTARRIAPFAGGFDLALTCR